MEREESVLDSIYEDDVEMVDVEEGELVDDGSVNETELCRDGTVVDNHKDSVTGNSKNKRKKNRSRKKKKSNSAPKVTDVNRFVLDTCRRLKEKKSYMIYNAVGCLGVDALSDILKEVDAIQVCGGQMTADGRRQRTGGGILWNILKSREPKAYKDIMNKSREFEKQFRTQSLGHAPAPKGNNMSSEEVRQPRANRSSDTERNNTSEIPHVSGILEQVCLEELPEQSELKGAGEPKPVRDRIRLPVRYDDLFEEAPRGNENEEDTA